MGLSQFGLQRLGLIVEFMRACQSRNRDRLPDLIDGGKVLDFLWSECVIAPSQGDPFSVREVFRIGDREDLTVQLEKNGASMWGLNQIRATHE